MSSESIGSIWGSIISVTVIASSIIHLIFGMVSIKNIVFRDITAIGIPLVMFIVGAIYSFLSMAIPAFSLAIVHYTLGSEMSDVEQAVYVASLVALCTYFSCGYTANLYSM